ncbi:MAG: DUF2283 domain-containing protein [Methanobrevibacter sp.]|nr:DUF2283 domain-containing protein [Methanobrevibacter sp.]MBQ2654692.1 DUF2283 domain-containing protein [Methanobrevibacter sp.]
MKENSIHEVIYKYDILSDTLGVKVNKKFQYGETVEMGDGILLDFDNNNVPVSLEILDASNRLNFPRESLNNIVLFKMEVCVEEKSISLNAMICVLVEDRENTKTIEYFTSNRSHFPNRISKLAFV